MLKRVVVWIGAIVIVLTMVQPLFIPQANSPVFLGLPRWLFYFAVLQIVFVLALWYWCFVLYKDGEE